MRELITRMCVRISPDVAPPPDAQTSSTFSVRCCYIPLWLFVAVVYLVDCPLHLLVMCMGNLVRVKSNRLELTFLDRLPKLYLRAGVSLSIKVDRSDARKVAVKQKKSSEALAAGYNSSMRGASLHPEREPPMSTIMRGISPGRRQPVMSTTKTPRAGPLTHHMLDRRLNSAR